MNEIKDILADIAADDRRAGDIIKRLRAFLSRGELDMKTLDMNEVIREVVTLVHSDAVMRNVSIRIDLEPGLPMARVDRVQMQQVLLNLIINGIDSLKNVPEGSRRITVTSRKQDNQYILVTVADSGTGLEEEHMLEYFEPYYTTKPEGMGMGLSINRSIVDAHNGEIWAENNPGGGAAFCFTLPIDWADYEKPVSNDGKMNAD
jgi:two-component system sensor kinase FixL